MTGPDSELPGESEYGNNTGFATEAAGTSPDGARDDDAGTTAEGTGPTAGDTDSTAGDADSAGLTVEDDEPAGDPEDATAATGPGNGAD